MAKNKKPRHKMRTRQYMSPFKITPEMVEQIREFFTRFCLIAEVTLPQGKCNAEDIAYISEVFNLCTMGIATRKWLDREELEEIMPLYNKAIHALHEVSERGHATGHYVCKGEELMLIRDMLIPAEQFLQDSLSSCPRRLIKEWHAMQEVKRHADVITLRQVPVEVFVRAIKRYES